MKRVLLKKFLGRGIMISPDIADEITETDYEKILTNPHKRTLINKDVLVEIRGGRANIEVVFPERAKTEVTAKDFLEFYKNKIASLGRTLTKKMNERPVSVNKARPNQRNTMLGVAREIAGNKFYLEDLTGKCEVETKTQYDITENDVVAVTGFFSGNKLFADDVIRPGLPIKKEVKKTETGAEIIFIFGVEPEEKIKIKLRSAGKKEFLMVVMYKTDEGSRIKITSLVGGEEKTAPTRPSKISATVGGVRYKIQFLQTPKTDSVENLAKFFSGRGYVASEHHVPVFEGDFNTIDEDTDIIFFGLAEKSGAVNHKGYTFVTVGENDKPVSIDLCTRSTRLVDF